MTQNNCLYNLYLFLFFYSESFSAKAERREGNSPDYLIRFQSNLEVLRKIRSENSGNIGLEAATVLRTRNSSSTRDVILSSIMVFRRYIEVVRDSPN